MEARARELVANKLRSIRADRDYTLEYVAINSKVNKDTISRYENNQVSMQIDNLERIISFYGYNFFIFFKEIYANKHNMTSKNPQEQKE